MPVPPPSDLLATISMFEQIKSEPIGFYSACPPSSSQSMSSRSGGASGDSAQQQSVITSSNNEDNKDVVQQQSLAAVSNSFKKYRDKKLVNFFKIKFQINQASSSGGSGSTPMPMMTEPKQEIITTPSGHQHTIQLTSAQHTPAPTPSSSRSKPQACKVCGKMLSSASSYYVHMKLHSGTKPFACTVCEAAFCRKPYLEVHMRTHTGKTW